MDGSELGCSRGILKEGGTMRISGGDVNFTYEYEDPTNEDSEAVELRVEATVSDCDTGRTYGPPEDCYPPEGGEVEDLVAYGPDGLEFDLDAPATTRKFIPATRTWEVVEETLEAVLTEAIREAGPD